MRQEPIQERLRASLEDLGARFKATVPPTLRAALLTAVALAGASGPSANACQPGQTMLVTGPIVDFSPCGTKLVRDGNPATGMRAVTLSGIRVDSVKGDHSPDATMGLFAAKLDGSLPTTYLIVLNLDADHGQPVLSGRGGKTSLTIDQRGTFQEVSSRMAGTSRAMQETVSFMVSRQDMLALVSDSSGFMFGASGPSGKIQKMVTAENLQAVERFLDVTRGM